MPAPMPLRAHQCHFEARSERVTHTDRTARSSLSAEPDARVGRLDCPIDGIEEIGADGVEIDFVA